MKSRVAFRDAIGPEAGAPWRPGREDPRDEIEAALRLTHHPDPRVRRDAVHELCPCRLKANHQAVWDRLIAMAGDEDAKVRGQVLHTLADGSPRERERDVVATIEGMQDDPDLSLRRRVRKLLAQYRRTGKINVL